jgi:Spy/CpxP family protein refolding chaperone
MKATLGILATVTLLVVGASTLSAQDSLPAQRPQARMRMHAPGTGMQPGMTPMQMRQGAAMQMQGSMGGRGVASGFAPGRLLAQKEFLGLTDAQVAEFERLDEGMRSAHDKAMKDVEARQQELQDLWQADKPDVNAIRRSFEALMKLHQDAQLSAIEATARAKGALTAEQLGKAQGLAQGRLMGARGSMGMRGGRTMQRGGRAMHGGTMMPRGGMRTPRPPIR